MFQETACSFGSSVHLQCLQVSTELVVLLEYAASIRITIRDHALLGEDSDTRLQTGLQDLNDVLLNWGRHRHPTSFLHSGLL